MVAVLGGLLLLEVAGRLAYRKVTTAPQRRAVELFLAGDHSSSLVQGCSPHPYCLYQPAPGLVARGFQQHNSDGFRGPELRQDDDVFRVVCLGGSTTYSWLADDPADAWPAQLGRILGRRDPRVEVVNAGLPRGTTAEALTTLHFRALPHAPRVAVLHAGFNDVFPILIPDYRPDYSHDRDYWKPYHSIVDQIVLRSRLLAIVRIHLNKLDPERLLLGADYVTAEHNRWIELWSDGSERAREAHRYEGLATNLRSMAAICDEHAIDLVLSPTTFRADLAGSYPAFAVAFRRVVETMRRVADGRDRVHFMDTEAIGIPQSEYGDECHLELPGLAAKAEAMAEFLVEKGLVGDPELPL